MSMKYYMSYAINRKLKNQTEKVFEGIARGRKKALENWFKDTWISLELTRDTILTYLDQGELDFEVLNTILESKRQQFKDFSQLFIINQDGKVNTSTYKPHIGNICTHLPGYIKGMKDQPLMYGPYIDEETLKIGQCNSKFFDRVTLMFSLPFYNHTTGRRAVLCGRIPNDVMSDVIQEEDTHVYKESGDNYLFMVQSNRDIAVGTAISRSRFEDNAFTLGENLKDGIRTKKWGTVKIKEHTEFEIVFNDPATQALHKGVKNTITYGENLEAWPGYPEYRHILVGGKGVLIEPPHCEEIWGMLCEGDIAEIYKFRSLNLKVPFLAAVGSALLFGVYYAWTQFTKSHGILDFMILWLLHMGGLYFLIKKLVVRPLHKTISILQQIAEGEGDLTKRVQMLSYDEIGELARWFNKFVNNQMTMIKRMGRASEDSGKSAHSLSDLTCHVKESVQVIEGVVIELVQTAQTQTTVFQTTKEKVSIISESAAHMHELIQQVNRMTNQTNDNAIESGNASKKVLVTMTELEEKMKQTLDSISILQKYSDQINTIVSVIDGISKQTQLLALNASIESARAGEAGKGFAVVAQEVSKLAQESTQAVYSISELVANVQHETAATIQNVQEIGSKVEAESISIKDTIQSFSKIQADITEVTKNVEGISHLVEVQTKELNEVTASTSEMVNQLTADLQDNHSRSSDVMGLVHSILRQTAQVEQSSKVLSHASENLNSIVHAFRL